MSRRLRSTAAAVSGSPSSIAQVQTGDRCRDMLDVSSQRGEVVASVGALMGDGLRPIGHGESSESGLVGIARVGNLLA